MPDQMSGLLSPFLRQRRIEAALPLLGSGRILDFGCGTGELARWLAAERYLGVDRDQESVEIARERFPDHEFLTVEAFETGNAKPRRGFDVVVALAVIEHLPEPVRWLAETGSVLADRGGWWSPLPTPGAAASTTSARASASSAARVPKSMRPSSTDPRCSKWRRRPTTVWCGRGVSSWG